MEDDTGSQSRHDWELLLMPGVCWSVWDEDGTLFFSLFQRSRVPDDFSSGQQMIDGVFPPDIAFLLTEIIHNAGDLNPGDSNSVMLAIPGGDDVWPGRISRLFSGSFILIWSSRENGSSSLDFCDISEHVRSERAVRKANEKLNFFNAIVRHDIINMVMGIVGYLDIIDEIVTDEEVGLLVRKSRALGDRIRRIAELTRSYQDLGIRPPSLLGAQETVSKITGRREFSDKISAEVSLNGIFLYVDRMFDVVIYELVRNSLQFGGKGVTITFSYAQVPEGLVLVVEDNGPGIAPEAKERIFARNYADRKGYGLYLVSEILDITGASIRETGTYGEGARFELMFPPETFQFRNNSA